MSIKKDTHDSILDPFMEMMYVQSHFLLRNK